MTGNKRDKNNTKKSWRIKNQRYICDCFMCEGNWYKRFLEKTRSRSKDIKYARNDETKKI